MQGHIWHTGYENNELKGMVFDDVPEALEKWHALGIKVAIPFPLFYFFPFQLANCLPVLLVFLLSVFPFLSRLTIKVLFNYRVKQLFFSVGLE